MKVLKWIIIILLIIVGLVLIIGLVMPKEMKTSASEEINLPAKQVFYSVATFQNRQAWDPWLAKEPDAKVTITSEPGFVGSEYAWEGDKLGKGKMKVDSVVPGVFIKSFIWFNSDKDEPGVVNWEFEESDNKTLATWSLSVESKNPFMKLMNQLFKGGLKKSLEQGLESLKTFLEENGVEMSQLSNIELKEFPPINAIIAEGQGTVEEMPDLMGRLFGLIMEAVNSQGLQPAGPPFSYYYDYDQATGITKVKAGIPLGSPGESMGEIKAVEFEGFKGISGIHTGSYDNFVASYNKLMEEAEKMGYETTWESWEFYYSDPSTEPDESKWKTEIVFPVKEPS
ncbi:MAG: GyrI-like domain-containing protein [Bacteroidales bacterium]|nr:GyrI-like domain-containing protein [Bacteroidales bacterium]